MNIEQAIQRVDNLERVLLQRLSDIVHVAALDLVQEIADRVIETGETADGGKFTPYSERPALAFLYFGQSVNAGGEAKVRKAAKEGRAISYKQFRRFNGRPVDFKNFSLRGFMWKSFGVLRVYGSGAIATLEIGMSDADANKKLADNNRREGRNIIAPSPTELAKFKAKITAQIAAGII